MKVLFRAETVNQDHTEETEGLKCINGVWYAIGKEYPCVAEEFEGIKLCAIAGEDKESYICKYDTRAIHFEDMLDSEDKPMFASLDVKNGIGGDILRCETEYQGIVQTFPCIYADKGNIFPFNCSKNFENKPYKDKFTIFTKQGIKK